MLLNKNTLLLLLVIAPSLSAMDGKDQNACTAMSPATHVIESFSMIDHFSEFTQLFLEEKDTLVRRPNFDVAKMLFHDSINYDKEETHGSLKLIVLRDYDKEQAKMTLRAFVGYTVSQDGKSFQGNLLAVKKEDRHKHYAEYLVRHGVEKAISAGATDMWLSTRNENIEAKAVYKAVVQKYPQYELVIEPAETRFPGNEIAIKEGVLIFNLRPKSQQP